MNWKRRIDWLVITLLGGSGLIALVCLYAQGYFDPALTYLLQRGE